MNDEQVKQAYQDYRTMRRQHYFTLLNESRGNRYPDLLPALQAGDVAGAVAGVAPLSSGQGPLKGRRPTYRFPLPNGGTVVKQSPKRDDENKAYIDYIRSSSGCDTSDGHNTSEQAPRHYRIPVREQKPAQLEMTSNAVSGAQAW